MANRLFVYGIFLDGGMRSAYGMTNPRYAVVRGYSTRVILRDIVEASRDNGRDLTGLLVDVDPSQWGRLDALEGGYERVKVRTSRGKKCWMYVSKYN